MKSTLGDMIVIGHRGCAQKAPENTMMSFQSAFNEGCQWVELDVQLTQDNVPVVCHDDKLWRTCGVHGRISQLKNAQLPATRSGESIPNLMEVMAFLRKRGMGLHMEIKDPRATPWACALVEKTDLCVVSSFCMDVVLRAKTEHSLPTLALFDAWRSTEDILEQASGVGADAIGVDFSKWVRRGMGVAGFDQPLFGYTLNTLKDMALAQSLGFSGVYSDDPGLWNNRKKMGLGR